MNPLITLKNETLGKEITIHNTPEPGYCYEVLDLGTVPGVQNTTQLINLVGERVNGTRLSPRDMSVSGWIFAQSSTEMAEYKRVLNRVINPKDDIALIYGDYKITARPDASIQYSTDKYERTRRFCKFLISLTAYNPLWIAKKAKLYRESSMIPVPLFPLKIPKWRGIAFGYIPAVSINNIDNIGDVDAGFTITFTASEGPVVNPYITNNKTGKTIEIIIDMEQGDQVEVATLSGDKHVIFRRGGQEIDLFKAVTKRSSMDLTLGTGVNDLSISARKNAANMTAAVVFAPEYLEVQE